jgi:two-component system, chemotaxis family, sensor histidine kinase and response regulator PixL
MGEKRLRDERKETEYPSTPHPSHSPHSPYSPHSPISHLRSPPSDLPPLIMITSDQEQQVKLQFLDEATDYLDTLESGLLGLSAGKVADKQLDALLRAAHSIKGGAAMMGYTTLARLGHHLEDYFKIIQYGKAAPPDGQIEQLLLGTVDKLRQIVALNRQGTDADAAWLETQVNPLFAQLRERLGEFNPEDEANMLASESGEDILTFLFESEVERSLTQLEASASGESSTSLYDELIVTAEELGGLAEMVELPEMGSLCQSVVAHLTAQPHQVRSIASLALIAWRRTQAMVLIGQTAHLPTEIELPGSGIIKPDRSLAVGRSSIEPESLAEPMPWSIDSLAMDESTIPEGNVAYDVNDLIIDPFPIDRSMLQDVTAADSFSLADFDLSSLQLTETEIAVEEQLRADDIADPFADFNLPEILALSTITASDDLDLDQFSTTEQNSDDIETEPDRAEEEPEPVEIIDGLARLDLSGDLTGDFGIDTEDRELFLALSSVFSDGEIEIEPDLISSSLGFKIPTEPAIDYLAQEAADLLSALDAAPEVAEDSPHYHHNSTVVKPLSGDKVAEQTIRVATKQLAEIGDLFGELTIDRNGLSIHLQGLRQLVVNLQLKVKQLEQFNFNLRDAYDSAIGETEQDLDSTLIQTHTSGSTDFTSQLDALEFDRYSDLHVLSQEVMDTVVQIEELTTDLDLQLNDAERTSRDLNRTAKQLQTGLAQVRMRPVSELFNRFPRAIRNLSIEHSKPIDLQLKGGTTLIERSVLEALNDPLMHLVRNAFDHGIEPSAVRRASGKSDTGTIQLSANHRGNQTVITIKDDGGGIDLDKIRAKVKKMGMDDREIANFKDSELIDLIFEPGFSTAAKVTDLSGRGVGMDVVRTNIRDLRGDISVDTSFGKGSTFTITVPFTMSVVRVLLVEVNGMWLAISSNIVEEILLLNPDQIVTTDGQKMLQWDDFSLRLIQPAQYLHLPEFVPQLATANQPTINCPTVLMIDRGADIVALQIDKFWGEQEVTVRQPSGNIKMPSGFTGCTILGDGRIVPLLDPIEFIRWIDGDFAVANAINSTLSFLPEDTHSNAAIGPLQRPRVLVVDDSINVRRFVALTLEKAGYLVEQAKDGQEAIEKLQAGLQTQAVVCDVEMPRMDGYGFLATVKGLPDFKNIPVLMLTSRSGDKHRKIAINLGASGYFSKPFQEQELLARLTEVVGV